MTFNETGAQAPSESPEKEEKRRPKKIIVFADGTGNAFSTQESNIWRMYQALDKSDPDQIARYVQGVGTSGFSLLARLDGATGFGVPSNVRKLYRFICWNWQPEDEIYMFGFSRGAFTIRTLAGLIGSQGLVPKTIDGKTVRRIDMKRNARGAWRAYRSETVPFGFWTFFQDIKQTSPTIGLVRLVRDMWISLWRRSTSFISPKLPHSRVRKIQKEQGRNAASTDICITFLGLFDTVEAYGLPVEELRSVVNWALWPISFRNRNCSAVVHHVSHALSIDDERKTFHPIIFDAPTDKAIKRSSQTINEVWFSGVHSDVGGGYPEDTLAYIPLKWMIAEATHRGLKFNTHMVEHWGAMAHFRGPAHDSRAKLASLYRYYPRTPTADFRADKQATIHYSVTQKIAFGSQGYAPKFKPDETHILMPDGTTTPFQQGKHGGATQSASMQQAVSEHSGDCKQKLAAEQKAAMAALAALRRHIRADDHLQRLENLVFWRRVANLGLLTTVITFLFLPLVGETIESIIAANAKKYDRITWILAAVDSLNSFIPGILHPWTNAIKDHRVTAPILIAAATLFYLLNIRMRDAITDRGKAIWEGVHTSPGIIRRSLHLLTRDARQNKGMQLAYATIAQVALPLLAAILFIAAIAGGFNRSMIYAYTARNVFCQDRKDQDKPLAIGAVHTIRDFSPKDICRPGKFAAEKGARYTVWIEPQSPFVDRTIISPVRGFESNAATHKWTWWALRRVRSEPWFTPIVQIGDSGDSVIALKSLENPTHAVIDVNDIDAPNRGRNNARTRDADPCARATLASPKLSRISDDATKLEREQRQLFEEARSRCQKTIERSGSIFTAHFTATKTGPVFFYVNDAVVAFPIRGYIKSFYKNNTGLATITVRRDLPPPAPRTNQAP